MGADECVPSRRSVESARVWLMHRVLRYVRLGGGAVCFGVLGAEVDCDLSSFIVLLLVCVVLMQEVVGYFVVDGLCI